MFDRINRLADNVDRFAKEKLEAVGAVPTESGASTTTTTEQHRSRFLETKGTSEDAVTSAARRDLLRTALAWSQAEEEDDEQPFFEDAIEASEAAFAAKDAEARSHREAEEAATKTLARRLEKAEAAFASETRSLRERLETAESRRLESASSELARRRDVDAAASALQLELAKANAELAQARDAAATKGGAPPWKRRALEAETALETLRSDSEARVRAALKDASSEAEKELSSLRTRMRKREQDFDAETATLVAERDDALRRARDAEQEAARQRRRRGDDGAQSSSSSSPPPPPPQHEDTTLLASKLVQKQSLLEEVTVQRDSLATKLADARRQLQRSDKLPLYHKHQRKSSSGVDVQLQRTLRTLRDAPPALRLLVLAYLLLLHLSVLRLLFFHHPCGGSGADLLHGPDSALAAAAATSS
mmetsp:Transcript_27576/g.84604  ORF Transcript_27576/g.84604 Transcript_27576/m.84604 type:complete len:421 (+) Transcript_27576:200-1462(+)